MKKYKDYFPNKMSTLIENIEEWEFATRPANMNNDRSFLLMPEHMVDMNDKELIDMYVKADEMDDKRTMELCLAEKLRRKKYDLESELGTVEAAIRRDKLIQFFGLAGFGFFIWVMIWAILKGLQLI